MITLDAERAGQALGVGRLAAPVTGVSIDSRSLKLGDLFVALRGERFDGHDYVEAALTAGASGAVVEGAAWAARGQSTSMPTGGAPLYEVPDTLAALGALAREVRRSSRATVFAITGSVGKTSTKDLLRAMLGRVCKVAATCGNQNNEVGVPLTLLSLEDDTEAVVVEMGMRGQGQIAALAAVAEPDVGLITNVHPVHLELLGTLDNIARAKAELVSGLGRAGSPWCLRTALPWTACLGDSSCRRVRFAALSGESGPDVSARPEVDAEVCGWLEPAGDGCDWVLNWPGGQTRLGVGRLAGHTLLNAVAAAAACYAAGLPVAECAAGIADVELSQGRGQTIEAGGLCLIDDTYNANPAAVRAAVEHLVDLAAKRGGRAVAVLGDMLELGPEEQRFHEQVGRASGRSRGGAHCGGSGPCQRLLCGVSAAGGRSMRRPVGSGVRGTWTRRTRPAWWWRGCGRATWCSSRLRVAYVSRTW